MNHREGGGSRHAFLTGVVLVSARRVSGSPGELLYVATDEKDYRSFFAPLANGANGTNGALPHTLRFLDDVAEEAGIKQLGPACVSRAPPPT